MLAYILYDVIIVMPHVSTQQAEPALRIIDHDS